MTTNNEGPALPPLAPTAKRLFLVRHGEVINPGGDRPVYYGALDVPLSPLGQQEATAAARYLAQYALAHVFCSPLSRAVYGAEQIAQLQQTNPRRGRRKPLSNWTALPNSTAATGAARPRRKSVKRPWPPLTPATNP